MQLNSARLTLRKAQTRETRPKHDIRNSVSYSVDHVRLKTQETGPTIYIHTFSTTFNTTVLDHLNLSTSVSRQFIPLSPT